MNRAAKSELLKRRTNPGARPAVVFTPGRGLERAPMGAMNTRP